MEKKEFVSPKLTIHGDIEKITLNGNLPNADSPTGVDDAQCNFGACS